MSELEELAVKLIKLVIDAVGAKRAKELLDIEYEAADAAIDALEDAKFPKANQNGP